MEHTTKFGAYSSSKFSGGKLRRSLMGVLLSILLSFSLHVQATDILTHYPSPTGTPSAVEYYNVAEYSRVNTTINLENKAFGELRGTTWYDTLGICESPPVSNNYTVERSGHNNPDSRAPYTETEIHCYNPITVNSSVVFTCSSSGIENWSVEPSGKCWGSVDHCVEAWDYSRVSNLTAWKKNWVHNGEYEQEWVNDPSGAMVDSGDININGDPIMIPAQIEADDTSRPIMLNERLATTLTTWRKARNPSKDICVKKISSTVQTLPLGLQYIYQPVLFGTSSQYPF